MSYFDCRFTYLEYFTVLTFMYLMLSHASVSVSGEEMYNCRLHNKMLLVTLKSKTMYIRVFLSTYSFYLRL